jgi:hypothetical protein
MIDKNTAEAGWKQFLGKTATELTRAMGDPFVAYSFREDEVYLYDSNPVTTIAIRSGLVVKCNDASETRRAVRVQPSHYTNVIVRGEGKIKGQLKDISVAGAAVLHSDETLFTIGSRAKLSLTLPIDGMDRFLEIACRVQATRIVNGMRSTVFLFDLTSSPRKKRMLSRYVLLRKLQSELDLDDALLWGDPKHFHASSLLSN